MHEVIGIYTYRVRRWKQCILCRALRQSSCTGRRSKWPSTSNWLTLECLITRMLQKRYTYPIVCPYKIMFVTNISNHKKNKQINKRVCNMQISRFISYQFSILFLICKIAISSFVFTKGLFRKN